MTLYELSFTYEQSAELLHARIRELKQAEAHTTDSLELQAIQKRLATLKSMLKEMRALTAFSRHYYERNYPKHEDYSL